MRKRIYKRFGIIESVKNKSIYIKFDAEKWDDNETLCYFAEFDKDDFSIKDNNFIKTHNVIGRYVFWIYSDNPKFSSICLIEEPVITEEDIKKAKRWSNKIKKFLEEGQRIKND